MLYEIAMYTRIEGSATKQIEADRVDCFGVEGYAHFYVGGRLVATYRDILWVRELPETPAAIAPVQGLKDIIKELETPPTPAKGEALVAKVVEEDASTEVGFKCIPSCQHGRISNCKACEKGGEDGR